jgi:AraC-like DNA-binding protein
MIHYVERPPHPSLRADVDCLWMVRDARARARRAPDRIVPDGCPELIVHLADPFSRRVNGRWRRQPRVFLAGTLSRPWLVRGGARVRTLGIRFRPGSVTRFLSLEMSAAIDREIGLSELIGAPAARLFLARLFTEDGRGRAFAFANRWLADRRQAVPPRRSEITQMVVKAILRARGRERIRDLSAGLGIHPRRIERAFAEDLGIRPKLFARIVRLQAALHGAGEGESAVDWALEAGYFDQAHMAKDFRVVAGRRARGPREADGEMARHFTAPRRLLAYLEGE